MTPRTRWTNRASGKSAHRLGVGLAVGLLAGGGLVLTGAPAEAATYAIPSNIDRTGKVDVTASLLAFIAKVPDGSTIQFPSGGRYRVDGTLKLVNRNRLTFEGNGAVILATPGTGNRERRHWFFQDGSAIVFRNLQVKGANPSAGTSDAAYQSTMEAQHGFDFEGVNGVELDRVTVTDVYGDFVYLGKTVAWTSNVWIHDSHFERNGRQGISLTGAQDVRIERNQISQTRRTTFDLEPNGAGWGVARATITNNDIGPGRLNFVGATGSGPVDDITISGNRLTGRAMNSVFSPPSGTRRSNVRFTGNTADTAYGNAAGSVIYVYSTTGVTVTGNVQPLQAGRGMTGVEVRWGCNTTVSGNTFANSVAEAKIVTPTC